jgi:hypothetical protein
MQRKTELTIPELALVAGTRALAGAGIGLLLADRMQPAVRRAVGWTLLSIGLITTVPLAMEVFGHRTEGQQWMPPKATGKSAELQAH